MGHTIVALDEEARWIFDEGANPSPVAMPAVAENRPRLVGLPTPSESGRHVATSVEPSLAPPTIGSFDPDEDDDSLEPPAWAGPGHPTIPVSVMDEEPSWDDILFGTRPSDS
jgi:hypothetical protein